MREQLQDAYEILSEVEAMRECAGQRDLLLIRLKVFKAQMLIMEVLTGANEAA